MAYVPYVPDFATVAELVYPVVVGQEFRQPEGEPERKEQPCCFGARLAIEFCMPREVEDYNEEDGEYHWTEYWQYEDGEEWLMDEIHCSHKDMCDVLFVCGADEAPFSGNEWPHHPEAVIKRMWSIEQAPGLNRVDNEDDREALFFACTGKTWARAEADFDRAEEVG